jgi:hypothetical protein
MRHTLERVPKAPLIVTPAQAGVQEFEKSGFPPKARGNDDLRLSCFVVTHQVRRFAGMTTKALMQRS